MTSQSRCSSMEVYISSTQRMGYLWVVSVPLEELLYCILLNIMQKFPEDIECVLEPVGGCGGLYLSNIEAAQNPRTLQRYGIEAVISAVKGKNLQATIPKHIQYLYIPAIDHQSFDLTPYFEDSNSFIQEERKRTNVLVHCMAGISRSVTLVIAYLIKCTNKTFEEAYRLVKAKRKIMHPNDAFLAQLKAYASCQRPVLAQVTALSNIYVNPKEVKPSRENVKPRQTALDYDQNLKENIRNLFKTKSPERAHFLR